MDAHSAPVRLHQRFGNRRGERLDGVWRGRGFFSGASVRLGGKADCEWKALGYECEKLIFQSDTASSPGRMGRVRGKRPRIE